MWFLQYVMTYMCFFFKKYVTSTSFHLFVVDFMVLNRSLFYLFGWNVGKKESLWLLWKETGSSGELQGCLEVMQGENGKGQSPARTETWLLP